jgi:hypothetical protein
MLHRAKVAKDTDSRWAAVCDCSIIWHCARWRDAYDAAYTHVYGARRIEHLGGIGFGSVRVTDPHAVRGKQ